MEKLEGSSLISLAVFFSRTLEGYKGSNTVFQVELIDIDYLTGYLEDVPLTLQDTGQFGKSVLPPRDFNDEEFIKSVAKVAIAANYSHTPQHFEAEP
ncbi:MAG: hypothetical protein HC772_07845 [Leptolyngbyaceae cyanobacterium CRU_2_3]|nr:hypothetical protein [Leptolyngbyaceae cyanobacterium CRU_2_3]